MYTLEVCISWIITSFNKCFKTSLHKCTNTTAKNCLLTEEVSLSLCLKCCLKYTSSSSTDTSTICKCKIKSFSCSILLYSNKTRCSFAFLILRTYCMTWSLRCDHCYINICWRNNEFIINVETVSEH